MPAVQTVTLEQLAPALARIGEETLARMDWRRVFRGIALVLESETKRNFEQSQAPDGTPWKPLKHRQGKPLRDTGLLMASLSARGQGHEESVSATGFTWGTNLEYAAIHQFGGTISIPAQERDEPFVFQSKGKTVFTRRIRAHKVTIPARPFLGLNDRIIRQIDALILDEALRAAG